MLIFKWNWFSDKNGFNAWILWPKKAVYFLCFLSQQSCQRADSSFLYLESKYATIKRHIFNDGLTMLMCIYCLVWSGMCLFHFTPQLTNAPDLFTKVNLCHYYHKAIKIQDERYTHKEGVFSIKNEIFYQIVQVNSRIACLLRN